MGNSQSRRINKKQSTSPEHRLSPALKILLIVMFMLGQCAVLGLVTVAVFRSSTAAAESVARQESSQGVITSDEYFWGQSPPVYPSPNGTGLGPWTAAYIKAKALVGRMTLDEKLGLTGGIRTNVTGCNGYIPALPRVDFPGLCLNDAGNGVRMTDLVSSWPSGISVGASWNRDLAHQRAAGMGAEFQRKGVNVALGPVVGPLGRIAAGGRNWEGFSNDPYLAGSLVFETVSGIQSAGVIASTKHFVGNEQETNRQPKDNLTSAVSANIDDKTMHEMYLWPFQDAIRAGTGSIMCSYQRINNSYGCANSKTLNGLLKTELAFPGFVVSDWDAQHAGYDAALAGLDMTMPEGAKYWGNNLGVAVRNGSVPEWRIDDMATRILAAWYMTNQDQSKLVPGVGIPYDLAKSHQVIMGKDDAYKNVLLTAAAEGHVLLKNTNGALPFKKPKLISIFGYSANVPHIYNPDSRLWNLGSDSLSDGDIASTGGVTGFPMIARSGTIISGGGSGANQPGYISSPFEALTTRARQDGTSLWWDFESDNPFVDTASDVCLVFGNVFASEGFDRAGLRDDYTDGLILNVAAQCSNTVVVLHNAGVRLVDVFIDNPHVTGLIFAHLPGQDSGAALVSLLYGETNPSGKLPYSVPRNETDLGPLANASLPDGIYTNFPQSDFNEGLFLDYRALDAKNITPRFEFGFGLSYTNFTFSNLGVGGPVGGAKPAEAHPGSTDMPGGSAYLFDDVATVQAQVTNTGSVAGAEVAQLYVGIPGEGRPLKELRGFEKPYLPPGGSATVRFALTRRDLSVWDVVSQGWVLQKGEYRIYVGSSSRDLPLSSTLTM